MTIANTTNRTVFAGGGGLGPYGFNFPFLKNADIKVYKTLIATGVASLLTEGVDYTLLGTGVPVGSTGGNVNLTVDPGATYKVTILRDPDQLQGVDYTPNDKFPADTTEGAFDKLTMLVIRLWEQITRSARLADSDVSGADPTLPTPVAGSVLGWDATALKLQNYISAGVFAITAFGQTLINSANAAAARAVLLFGTGIKFIVSGDLADGLISWVKLSTDRQQAASELVDLLHINSSTGHRDLIRAGYVSAFFNQQWGGAPHYFELEDGAGTGKYKFEATTGSIQVNDPYDGAIAQAAGFVWRGQGFKVSVAQSVSAIWVRIYKTGNPLNNLEMRIIADDGTGKPNGAAAIANGTATAQSGKLHCSDVMGQWVRFVFPVPCALVAGTQYHITLKSSGAVDAANYWTWRYQLTTGLYPHGRGSYADVTPTWTAAPTVMMSFLVEAASTVASFQAGGIFNDGKLQFFEGSPLNQSNARVKDLKDFQGFDLTDFTLLVRGTAWTKDRTILDITYGLDHDRIVLRSNTATGFAQVDVYDSAGTKKTIVATTIDLSAGNHDVAIRVRAKGDGADVVQLWVDGAQNGVQLAAQTIAFDPLFGQAKIGTFWIGGGWQITPAWTQKLDMTALPSTLGWTWTGTGVEAACFSVSGGKGFQNRTGYAAADTGHYAKAAIGLSNANGWATVLKGRSTGSPNDKGTDDVAVIVEDGTKSYSVQLKEFFINANDRTTGGPLVQIDHKNVENVILLVGKGSDALVFANGRLISDSTGLVVTADATNKISVGDVSNTVGENADAIYDYFAYYNTAWLPPQFTSGSLSELAIWNGDRTAILAALYNAGVPISVKQFCGLQKNFVGDAFVQRVQQQGITSSPSSASNAYPCTALIPEMECFGIGSFAAWHGPKAWLSNSTAGSVQNYVSAYVDGVSLDKDGSVSSSYAANFSGTFNADRDVVVPFGLHKFEFKMGTGGGTLTATNQRRASFLEIRA